MKSSFTPLNSLSEIPVVTRSNKGSDKAIEHYVLDPSTKAVQWYSYSRRSTNEQPRIDVVGVAGLGADSCRVYSPEAMAEY